MKVFTKESLISDLMTIGRSGWVQSCRKPGNDGAVGNTLEQLLGIDENNLPLPNAAEWELKGQRRKTRSLVTLFHMDPSPQAMGLVNNLLIAKYGWPLNGRPNELSFRQTISTISPSDRGFQVVINEEEQKVEISFDASVISKKHQAWLQSVEQRAGLGQLNPQPYWGFYDLQHKAGTKLKNTFFVLADSKVQGGVEYFQYNGILMLQTFSFEKFLDAIREGLIKVDFDARNGFGRSGHNHGTKFRVTTNLLPTFYATVSQIWDQPLHPKERLKTIDIATVRKLGNKADEIIGEEPTIVQ